MKKRILLILLTLLISLGAVLGCAKTYPEVEVKETPDKKYAVTSNGGMVVQKGDFIYFVNGFKPIADVEGNNNVWGKVEKGGIYYAKLTDGKDVQVNDYFGQYTTYDNSDNNFDEEFSGFITEERTYTDQNDEEQTKQQIVVNPVVSKLVTNGGYIDGGIYIIDDYIYYGTPTTKKDKKGNVQYDLVDFFRTRIDGKGTQYIYTSKSTSEKPVYGYYKYNGSVYAVFYESSEQKIYSVEIKNNKVKKAVVLADNVTSALLPQKTVYYEGISQDTPEDYIYYTRDIDIETDPEDEGNILEKVRPNGDERDRIVSGAEITLDKVYQGHLFYFINNFEGTTNKHYFVKDLTDADKQPVSIFFEPSKSFPTNVFGIMANQNDFLALATKGSNTVLYISGQSAGQIVYNNKSKVLFADANNAYLINENSSEENEDISFATVYRLDLISKEISQLFSQDVKVDFLKIDFAGSYVFSVATANEIVQTIEKDGEDVTVLAKTDYYIKLKNLNSATGTEWDMGWLDKEDYPA
jgi:hypothetical protein